MESTPTVLPFQVLITDHMTKPVQGMAVDQEGKRFDETFLFLFWFGIANHWQDKDPDDHDQISDEQKINGWQGTPS